MKITKVYFDLTSYEKERGKFFQNAYKLESDDQTKALVKYLLFLLKNYEDGVIGPKKLAYDVAGLMGFDLEKGHPLEQIIWLGADLELPDAHVDGDPKTKMKDLLSKIKKAAKDYKVKLNLGDLHGGSMYFEGNSAFGFGTCNS